MMMNRNLYLIAVAAGKGVRMGSKTPKQFMEICGKPILRRTLERFIEACPDIHIVTVLPEEYIPLWKDCCYRSNFDRAQILVKGGMTRFHSVRNALARIPDGAIVAVHDGVRPLLSTEMIRKMFSMMENCRALVPVVPSVDTLKALRKDPETGQLSMIPGAEPDRSEIFAVQTPQMFRIEDLRDAYSLPYDMKYTDDSSVAMEKGIPVSWCYGDRFNIKITSPDDIVIAEALLKSGLR